MAAFLRSDDGSLLNNEELIRVDDADGCGCPLTCREKLSEGDVAELYSSIAMPGDDAVDTTYKAYRKNEDNSYSSVDLEAGTAWILGSGFGIHVTAEAVSSQGLDNAFAAFLLAE